MFPKWKLGQEHFVENDFKILANRNNEANVTYDGRSFINVANKSGPIKYGNFWDTHPDMYTLLPQSKVGPEPIPEVTPRPQLGSLLCEIKSKFFL